MNPADDFARLRVALTYVIPSVESWRREGSYRERVGTVATAVRDGNSVADPDPEDQRSLLATLDGYDAAFIALNPFLTGVVVEAGLAETAVCLDVHGRLNDDTQYGLLLARLCRPTRDWDVPDRMDLLFKNVVWVAADGATTGPTVRHSSSPSRFRARAVTDGITVGTAPFIEDYRDLEWSYPTTSSGQTYRIEQRDSPATLLRVGEVLDAWGPEVTIGLVPEMAGSAKLSAEWFCEGARRFARKSATRWLLGGTGNLDEDDPPRNRAQLIDLSLSEPVVTQDKLMRFDISSDLRTAGYRLPGAPPDVLLREDISPGETLEIVEMGAVRLAVLICEDLARLEVTLQIALSYGVSLLLVPVLSKPILPHHWESQSASSHCQAAGTTVLVFNSLVIARLGGALDAQPTALAQSPQGWVIQATSADADVARFTLKREMAPVAEDDEYGRSAT